MLQVVTSGNMVCCCSETVDIYLWQSRHWAALSQDAGQCTAAGVSSVPCTARVLGRCMLITLSVSVCLSLCLMSTMSVQNGGFICQYLSVCSMSLSGSVSVSICLCVTCLRVCVQNADSYLSWIDVSCGKQVCGFTTGLGRLDVMCQNPANGVIHLGHSGGLHHTCTCLCTTHLTWRGLGGTKCVYT